MKFFVNTNSADVLQNGEVIEVDFVYDGEPSFESSESTDAFDLFFFSLGKKNYISKFVFKRENLFDNTLWEKYNGLTIVDEATGDEYTPHEFAELLEAF